MESTPRTVKTQTYHYIARLLCGLVIITILSCKNNSTNDYNHLVFRYNEHKNIGSLDPAFSKDLADIWATHQLFNGLVQMDDQLNVKPCIAKHWTITDSATVYTFSLRTDVFFISTTCLAKTLQEP